MINEIDDRDIEKYIYIYKITAKALLADTIIFNLQIRNLKNIEIR